MRARPLLERRPLAKSNRSERELALSVLDYFLENPRSVEDLEAIARWRLLNQETSRVVTETDRALRWLVAEQQLLRVDTPGLAPRFRLNPDRDARGLRLAKSSRRR